MTGLYWKIFIPVMLVLALTQPVFLGKWFGTFLVAVQLTVYENM